MAFGQNNDSLLATSNNYFQATLFYEARDYPNALVYFDKVMLKLPIAIIKPGATKPPPRCSPDKNRRLSWFAIMRIF